MKKLFQICLVAVLILVLSQVAILGPALAPANSSSIADVSAGDAYAAICTTSVKGIVCFTPQVGWNS